MARQDLKYKDWVIPARTPIAVTIVDMDHDIPSFSRKALGSALAWKYVFIHVTFNHSAHTHRIRRPPLRVHGSST